MNYTNTSELLLLSAPPYSYLNDLQFYIESNFNILIIYFNIILLCIVIFYGLYRFYEYIKTYNIFYTYPFVLPNGDCIYLHSKDPLLLKRDFIIDSLSNPRIKSDQNCYECKTTRLNKLNSCTFYPCGHNSTCKLCLYKLNTALATNNLAFVCPICPHNYRSSVVGVYI